MTVSAKRCTRQQFLGWQECDGGLKEMEPAALIPSYSHTFKSESLTQMKQTKRSTFTHAYIWESTAQ